MEPNTTNNVVAIENVTFTDPDENIRKAINREESIFHVGCIFLLIGIFAVFWLICLLTHNETFKPHEVVLISLFTIPAIIRLIFPSKFQICYGTVLHHFKTTDTENSYDHISILLDGTDEEVHKLTVCIHGESSEIVGKHVMLCRYGKPSLLRSARYEIYPTDTLEKMI